MKFIFSGSILTLLLVAFALTSNHYGFAQKLALPAFVLIALGIILYLLELAND